MWPRKKKPVRLEDDTAEARTMRVAAQRDIDQLQKQAPAVHTIAARLIERRALNHFGDDIQVTFRPRET